MIKVEFADLDELLDFSKRLVNEFGKKEPEKAATRKEKPPVQEKKQTKKPEEEAEEGGKDPAVTEPEAEQTVTLEEVRAKLAELNKAGKRAEVKTLLSSFGAEKLSGINPDQYGELMKLAEEL